MPPAAAAAAATSTSSSRDEAGAVLWRCRLWGTLVLPVLRRRSPPGPALCRCSAGAPPAPAPPAAGTAGAGRARAKDRWSPLAKCHPPRLPPRRSLPLLQLLRRPEQARPRGQHQHRRSPRRRWRAGRPAERPAAPAVPLCRGTASRPAATAWPAAAGPSGGRARRAGVQALGRTTAGGEEGCAGTTSAWRGVAEAGAGMCRRACASPPAPPSLLGTVRRLLTNQSTNNHTPCLPTSSFASTQRAVFLSSGERRTPGRGSGPTSPAAPAAGAPSATAAPVALPGWLPRGVVGSSPSPAPLAACCSSCSPELAVPSGRGGCELAPSTSALSVGAKDPSEERLTSEAALRLSPSAGASTPSLSAAAAAAAARCEPRRPSGGARGPSGDSGGGKEARSTEPATPAAAAVAAAKEERSSTLVARAGQRPPPAKGGGGGRG